jgi:hypothetical protein
MSLDNLREVFHMSTQMTDDDIRRKAISRVQAKKGFFTHLVVYLAVNIFLWVIWWVTMGGTSWGGGMRGFPMWPIFPTIGWGIGLVIHCLSVFAFHGGWEDSEVEKEIAKMKKSGG